MEQKLLKLLKMLLTIVHIVNLIVIVKFIRLHILYYPSLTHDLMLHEVIVMGSSIFFITIHLIIQRHPKNLRQGESKGSN